MVILSAIMILQGITGVRAEPLFAEFGDANKGVREGMPMGAVVHLSGLFFVVLRTSLFYIFDRLPS